MREAGLTVCDGPPPSGRVGVPSRQSLFQEELSASLVLKGCLIVCNYNHSSALQPAHICRSFQVVLGEGTQHSATFRALVVPG